MRIHQYKNKSLLVSFIFFIFLGSAFSENEYSGAANRRTALRCLETASNYIFDKNWEAAKSQACFGIAYDDSVSDLWYVYAVAENALGKTKAAVLLLIEKAINCDSWSNYNRDNARLLYADILCDTGRMSEALAVLDSQPFLYSSDSELIRIKALYRLKDSASVSKARNKIDGARRIYSSDVRFPLVFFKNENPSDENPVVKRLASFFVSQLDFYSQKEADISELEIYSALFAQSEEKIRILKSFNAKEFRNPLYAQEAFKENLIGWKEAADYIFSFADKKIDFELFRNFILLLSDENSIEYVKKYLEAFSGEFSFDIDGDGIENLTALFSRGRPMEISFDQNQDGEPEWTVSCDFGIPVSGYSSRFKMNFQWGGFPFLHCAEFFKDGMPVEKFNFAPESLSWSPVQIEKDSAVSEKYGIDFFVPVLKADEVAFNISDFLDAASGFEVLLSSGEKIHFMLLNGNLHQALYYTVNGALYAQAVFENNVPVLRSADFDNDGIFETTEFYGIDSDKKMKFHSMEDERQIVKNLFGLPFENAEFYLKMIQVDRNRDTVPDFTEEYLENGGKISSWDTDDDGNWDLRYVAYSDGITEESMFYTVPGHSLVTVRFENGVPVKVSNGDENLFVFKDSDSDFYWLLGNASFDAGKYSALAKKSKSALDKKNVQGGSMLVAENEEQSVMCIRIGSFDFGILIENENGN
ncbi:tetratricopeptide repeat protein [Treponema sp.]|uniref:tetratricopeptide repeat protein n=1 Tax=Treponema sp. TaxID=166 RepID=UPI003F01ED0F